MKALILSTIFVLFQMTFASAKLLEVDLRELKADYYDPKEVCIRMGIKEPLLIESANYRTLDCMGKKVDVYDFCRAQKETKNFLRGLYISERKKIACQKGSSAKISILCDKRDGPYCEKPKASCLRMRQIFAFDLELVHFSTLHDERGKVLNCHFQEKIALNAIDTSFLEDDSKI